MPVPAALAVPTIISSLSGVGKFISGLGKSKTKLPTLPKYSIPPEVERELQLYETLSKSNLPGYNLAENKISGSTAQGAKRISEFSSDSSQALGALTKLYTNQMAEQNDLAIKNAMYKRQQQDALANALRRKAEYVDKAWNWNVGMPYQNEYNRAMGERAAGMEILGSGLSDITGTAMNFAATQAWNNALNQKDTINNTTNMNPYNIKNYNITEPIDWGIQGQTVTDEIPLTTNQKPFKW